MRTIHHTSFKTVLLGAALTIAEATPSPAQSYDPDVGTGNIVPLYAQAAPPRFAQDARSDYAQIVPRPTRADRKLYARVRLRAGMPAFSAFNRQDEFGGGDPDP